MAVPDQPFLEPGIGIGFSDVNQFLSEKELIDTLRFRDRLYIPCYKWGAIYRGTSISFARSASGKSNSKSI
jgi:hypothetical protein